jgi:hypothetical protein
MSASTIFFNGRLISVPGAYSKVDASGLEAVGLGASGFVALVGTSIGGKPYSAIDESDVRGNMQIATRPQHPFDFFRSGDLREGAPLVFGPSVDEDIPSGAQAIYFVKVNPAAAAGATFNNTDGAALVLTAADYGYFTNQIRVEIGTGTSKGKIITIDFETTEEVIDNVGGDVMFNLTYLSGTPAKGFSTITAEVTASAILTAFTRAAAGLDADVSNQVTAGQKIELVSSSAADTAVVVEIIGTDATNAAQREMVTLTGTAPIDTQNTWNSFHGARIYSGTAAGTITLRNDGGGTTIATLTAGTPTKGLDETTDHTVSGTAITYVADAATTARVTALGLSSTGAVQVETVQLNGAVPVPGTALWKRLDYLAVGELAAARTLTVSGQSVNAPFDGFDTLQKIADKFNGTAGYTLTLVTGRTTIPGTALDVAAPVSIKSAANPAFYADLYLLVEAINANSDLVTAAEGSPGTGVPDNTTAPVFLTGGHEGSATPGQEAVPFATTADWQASLDLLKKVFVNSVAVLTGDPAIHAQLSAHCAYMGGVGRAERDGFVGLLNAAQTDVPTKTEAKSQIVDLNTRHIRAWAQTVERYNTAGERQEFQTPFGASILAGMQAGSPVATSLTHKYMNVLKIRNDNSWNAVDDAEEMIQAGLVFAEVVDGVGRRVVRNVTTHLTSSNLAYTEGSVNEAVNFSVFNFRTTMERNVGRTGFAGSVNAASGLAVNALGLLVGVSLVAWRSLDIQLILDVLEVEVEIAPVLPINFVEATIHLVSVPQSAAAAS